MKARYTPTIMDGAVVRYVFEEDVPSVMKAQVNASRNGVSLSGSWPVFSDEAGVRLVIFALEHALETHRQMKIAVDPHAVAKAMVADCNSRVEYKIGVDQGNIETQHD